MVRTKLILFILTAWAASTPALGLNGLRPIGVSAESNSMGGTGVAQFYNYYDALYKNPALMSFAPLQKGESQGVFGMTYGSFKPKVKATYGEDQEYKKPINKTSALFPSAMGAGHKWSDTRSFAVGVYGGGGGADYGPEADSIFRAKSKTTSYTLTVGVSEQRPALVEGLSFGGNISVSRVETRADNLSSISDTMVSTGGRATVLGSLFGAAYRRDRLVVGAALQPAQTAFLADARDIDNDGEKDNLLFTAIPNEAALGISWTEPFWMVTADYRYLQWSTAEFLKSVGWQDQHVLGFGVEVGGAHRGRVGLNISNSAVVDRAGTDGFSTTLVSERPLIRLAGDAFAATSGLGVTKVHYTAGTTHQLSPQLKLNSGLIVMEPAYLERSGFYERPTGQKLYGWKSQFSASTLQFDLTRIW